jgi:hypothetical protein
MKEMEGHSETFVGLRSRDTIRVLCYCLVGANHRYVQPAVNAPRRGRVTAAAGSTLGRPQL